MEQKNFEVNLPKHMKYMEVKLRGTIELETLRALSSEADKYINLLNQKPKTVKVLTDVSEVEKISIRSRKYGGKWAANHPEFRIAFYGQSLFIKYILNAFIKVNSTSKSMTFFNSKEVAIEWLHNN